MSKLNRKAVELSMNFLVIMILSLVIFGFGVTFAYKFRGRSDDILNTKFGELNTRVEDLLCQSSDKSCIGIDRLIIKRGEHDFFNMKILNTLNDPLKEIFVLRVKHPLPPSPPGYDSSNTPLTSSLQFTPFQQLKIRSNEEITGSIPVVVPNNAQSGTYILNIQLYYLNSGIEVEYDRHQVYVVVP